MKLTIVTPVYNDWQSLVALIETISLQLNEFEIIHLIAVNDGSIQSFPENTIIPVNIRLTILNLTINVGHQRAIIIGLCYVSEKNLESELIIVMDSDGEDNPGDIRNLISSSLKNNNTKIVFARRNKRSEGIKFRVFYFLYKMLFRNLTGEDISFGNFSCIPVSFLPRITHNSDFWNHYSASVIKSKIPYTSIPTQRGKRYFGKSKMDFTNLVIHGISSLSLYLDTIIVRVLKLSLIALLIIIGFLSIILYVKFFTELAIPGWTSFLFTIVINIIITIILFTFLVILQHLNNRNQNPIQPLRFYKQMILSINEKV
jgi:hypothetical protein